MEIQVDLPVWPHVGQQDEKTSQSPFLSFGLSSLVKDHSKYNALAVYDTSLRWYGERSNDSQSDFCCFLFFCRLFRVPATQMYIQTGSRLVEYQYLNLNSFHPGSTRWRITTFHCLLYGLLNLHCSWQKWLYLDNWLWPLFMFNLS